MLQKAPDNTIFKRVRAFIGPMDWSNYTFEADVRGATRRRQMGDIGITAQRYSLVLYGNRQQLKLEPWEPETERTATVPFAWKPDAWYHLKLRVENTAGRQGARAGQGVGAGQPEPAAWTIDKVDPIGNRQGAPGLLRRRAVRRVSGQLETGGQPMKRILLALSFVLLASTLVARTSARPIPAPATGPCGAARPTATWCRT